MLNFWSQIFIKKHLEELNDNDILVYCDSGSTLNYLAKQRFFEYIDILNNSKNGNLRFESKKNHIEKEWTTKELFQYKYYWHDILLKREFILEFMEVNFLVNSVKTPKESKKSFKQRSGKFINLLFDLEQKDRALAGI